jgi:hypothetical protein
LDVAAKIAATSLRDLVALFARYRIGMRQLRQFCTPSNRRWFRNPQAFWFKKVFGNYGTNREERGR